MGGESIHFSSVQKLLISNDFDEVMYIGETNDKLTKHEFYQVMDWDKHKNADHLIEIYKKSWHIGNFDPSLFASEHDVRMIKIQEIIK